MNNGSLKLGTYFGIPVGAHWSVALIAGLFGVTLSRDLGAVAATVAVVAFFVSILAHEFGHALVARRFGVDTQSIDLWALGGVARLDREAPSPRADGLIAGAGPFVSLVIGVIAVGGSLLVESATLRYVGAVNVILAVFNMLPGAPLDGGRVLRAVRWARTDDKYRAMREAGNVGQVLGWCMGIGGLALMFNGQGGAFIAITGVFIAVAAKAEVAASYVGERLDGVKVRDLTWFGVAHAGADMDAGSMLDQRSRLGRAGMVAVDANDDGQLDGLVLEDELWALPVEQRARVMLHTMLVPFSQTARADPDDDLASVLPRLDPRRPLVTVWSEGELAGVIPPEALRSCLDQASGT